MLSVNFGYMQHLVFRSGGCIEAAYSVGMDVDYFHIIINTLIIAIDHRISIDA